MKKYLLCTLLLTNACSFENKEQKQEQKPIQVSLSEYTVRMMDKCGATKISAFKKELLVKQIVRVSEERLTDRTAQEAFITLICIESKFNQSVRSPVGAIGMTQVMPKYVKDFASLCSIEVLPDDAFDTEINLILGACYFNSLLKDKDIAGNVGLALGAYNAGKYGDTFKKLTNMQAINPETANYISKYLVLRESMDQELSVINTVNR